MQCYFIFTLSLANTSWMFSWNSKIRWVLTKSLCDLKNLLIAVEKWWNGMNFTGRGWCGYPSNDQKDVGNGAIGLWRLRISCRFDDLCQGGPAGLWWMVCLSLTATISARKFGKISDGTDYVSIFARSSLWISSWPSIWGRMTMY